METKINIAAILKDKPQETKLYDWLHNIYVELDTISTTDTETVVWCTNETDNNTIYHRGYSEFGTERGYPDGLQILFPSKEMRDWLKFTWKKGDVLQHSEYPLTVIFESFEDDAYTSFKCKYCFDFESASKWLVSNSQCSTKHFYKVSEEEAKEFIRKVELNYNGKLNRETLEIEPAQPEFKDGDILLYKSAKFTFFSSIFILNTNRNEMSSYVRFSIGKGSIDYDVPVCNLYTDRFRYATEEEKQQLFDALAKEGKAWDAEKKLIVDLKPKCEFKPFDKVLCRNSKDDTWEADFFARLTRKEIDYTQSGKYLCVGDLWMYCIPYNEETAHLLGTTDEWKGSEG